MSTYIPVMAVLVATALWFVFAGDLVPGLPWVNAAITMGYDRFPERLIDEKAALLEDLEARGGRLVYTHDPEVALSALGRDTRRRIVAVDPMSQVEDLAA